MRALVALVVVAGVAHAQPAGVNVTPAQALAKVEATYKKPAQLAASFEQTLSYAATGITSKNTGALWIAKPDKIRFDYTAKDPKRRPLDKQFLYDGAKLSLIDHKNTEITEKVAASTDLPTLVRFFTGAGSLTSEFTVAAPANKNRLVPGAVVIQLSPKQPNAAYAELYLVIDPTAWTVTQATVINSSGDSNTFTFSKVDTSKTAPATWFQLDPKTTKGYKVTKITAPAAPATSGPPARRSGS